MKILLITIALFPIIATAQFIPSVGAGMSLTHLNEHVQIEAGYTANKVYVGVPLRFNFEGYAALTVSPTIGYNHSWNNRALHELVTMPFVRYEIPAYVPGKQPVNNKFSFGIRHYIYNCFTEASYTAGRIDITIGWSFKSLYK